MASFKIEGGHKLNGSITPQGAKNEVLQILCAVLLTPERVASTGNRKRKAEKEVSSLAPSTLKRPRNGNRRWGNVVG